MGYEQTDADNIKKIRQQLPEWNLSAVSGAVMEAGASFLMKMRAGGRPFPDMDAIDAEREYLAGELRLRGCRVYPSNTVYLLFKAEEDLYERLLEKGILIRDCSDFRGLSRGFFRVAVKNRETSLKFLRAFDGE
ncbi:MAG: hypothetical protein Q4G47_02185 [Lachnospiraceae bacterium]|nr:hypothetical protein [Lachnospiraceae bacterium]